MPSRYQRLIDELRADLELRTYRPNTILSCEALLIKYLQYTERVENGTFDFTVQDPDLEGLLTRNVATGAKHLNAIFGNTSLTKRLTACPMSKTSSALPSSSIATATS